jgi:zinc transporter 1/2/3
MYSTICIHNLSVSTNQPPEFLLTNGYVWHTYLYNHAGIFLMLAFTHLIPHSLQTLEAANISPMLALQATVAGYLVVLAVEKLLFDTTSIMYEVNDHSTPIRRPSIMGSSVLSEKGEDVDGDGDGDTHSSSSSPSPSLSPPLPSRPRSTSIISQQSAIVLLLAMAVHSLFETVALGMASDSRSAVMMASSVALHQPAESLALLVAFLKTSMERRVIVR